ncbi:MAG: hypothetical protein OXU31_04220, partial [Gammaproteobacteria bacterium]|nr:hypothetical protein [Gammaproteobacteria bacterium]
MSTLTRQVTFNILADSQPEPDETIVLPVPRVNTAHAFHTTTDTFTYGDPLTITIRANDADNRYVPPEPTFAVAVDNADTAEGGTAVFTVTLGGSAPASGSAVTVDWAVSGGASASDYEIRGADTDGTLRFTALGSQTLNFAITDDDASEPA